MPPTCVQSTIDVKADKSYERKVAKNIAISVGVGMLILLVIIWILNKDTFINSFKFGGKKLFDFGNSKENNLYLFFMILFFLISAACFIGYGGRMKVGKGPKKEKDTIVSGLLAAAIICLLISAIMLWFKVYVYTLTAAAA